MTAAAAPVTGNGSEARVGSLNSMSIESGRDNDARDVAVDHRAIGKIAFRFGIRCALVRIARRRASPAGPPARG
jgi:hypothetical protein